MAIIIWNQFATKKIPRISGFILAVWLGYCIHGASGQLSVTPDVPVARVGQTVTLNINDTLSAFSAVWYKGLSVSEANRILTYGLLSNVTTTGPWYNGKEAALPGGSLRLTDVWRNHTGSYTVRLLLADGATHKDASAEIGVYDVLTPPTLVNTSGSGFTGDEFTMECQAGGQTVQKYAFFKDTINVACDQQRINCSEHSSVLSFHPLKESDSGSYTCTITNPVSHNTSLPLGIKVKVAPISNVTISSNQTSERLWEYEDSVQLSCAAQGTEPVFFWMRGGTALPQDPRYQLTKNNSSLTINPVMREDNGTYHCNASNSANTESSDPLPLHISWRPNGSIDCGANKISDMIEFSCSWPGGNPPANVHMLLSHIINQSNSNAVLSNASLSNVTANMTLRCNGHQDTRNSSCALNLGLPDHPNFKNNSHSEPTEGSLTSLTVNLESSSSMRASSVHILPANFTWYNGSSRIDAPPGRVEIYSNGSFSRMTISQVTVSDNGTYNCHAENLMGKTIFSFLINVQPPQETTTSTTTTATTTKPGTGPNDPSDSGGLSGGAIAGIVIGVVALVVIIGVTVYCVLKNKKGKKHESNSRSKQGVSNVMPMNDTSREGDVNYAELKFKNNQEAKPPADKPAEPETLYAPIRKN